MQGMLSPPFPGSNSVRLAFTHRPLVDEQTLTPFCEDKAEPKQVSFTVDKSAYRDIPVVMHNASLVRTCVSTDENNGKNTLNNHGGSNSEETDIESPRTSTNKPPSEPESNDPGTLFTVTSISDGSPPYSRVPVRSMGEYSRRASSVPETGASWERPICIDIRNVPELSSQRDNGQVSVSTLRSPLFPLAERASVARRDTMRNCDWRDEFLKIKSSVSRHPTFTSPMKSDPFANSKQKPIIIAKKAKFSPSDNRKHQAPTSPAITDPLARRDSVLVSKKAKLSPVEMKSRGEISESIQRRKNSTVRALSSTGRNKPERRTKPTHEHIIESQNHQLEWAAFQNSKLLNMNSALQKILVSKDKVIEDMRRQLTAKDDSLKENETENACRDHKIALLETQVQELQVCFVRLEAPVSFTQQKHEDERTDITIKAAQEG